MDGTAGRQASVLCISLWVGRPCLMSWGGVYRVWGWWRKRGAVRRRTVLAACIDARMWPLLVPARATWLLQPLDTHVFLSFKACLRREYQAARCRTEDGDVCVRALIVCMCEAVRQVSGRGATAICFCGSVPSGRGKSCCWFGGRGFARV